MSYVCPRCGAVTYGSHVADGNVQLFEGVLTNTTTAAWYVHVLLIDVLLVSLKTEGRTVGYRLSACLRALLPALVSVGNPGHSEDSPGFSWGSDRSSVAESDYCCVMME